MSAIGNEIDKASLAAKCIESFGDNPDRWITLVELFAETLIDCQFDSMLNQCTIRADMTRRLASILIKKKYYTSLATVAALLPVDEVDDCIEYSTEYGNDSVVRAVMSDQLLRVAKSRSSPLEVSRESYNTLVDMIAYHMKPSETHRLRLFGLYAKFVDLSVLCSVYDSYDEELVETAKSEIVRRASKRLTVTDHTANTIVRIAIETNNHELFNRYAKSADADTLSDVQLNTDKELLVLIIMELQRRLA